MSEMCETNKYQKRIITIPNILSFIRLCLIPVIVWLYLGRREYLTTGIVVIISFATDVVDGFIARKFNMISDVGKVLDPFADKATQIVVMMLLSSRFPLMLLTMILSVIKEAFMAISGAVVIKKCGIVLGANWHGKLATGMVIFTFMLHLLWVDISSVVSTVFIILSSACIILSLVLYAIRNFDYILHKNKAE